MKLHKNIILVILVIFIPKTVLATVRIVCSAALTDQYFEFRQQQYIDSFNILARLGYPDFYVVEAVRKKGPTFLENYTKNVFYATVNNPRLRNNGINEAKTLLEGCRHFHFDPNDIIIKLTGRHSFITDYLIKLVENNQGFDAFVKVNEDENAWTVGFAMRYKYFKEMFENIDYDSVEKNMIPIEYKVGDYIKKQKKENTSFKVFYLDRLDIKANLYGSSTCPGVNDITIF